MTPFVVVAYGAALIALFIFAVLRARAQVRAEDRAHLSVPAGADPLPPGAVGRGSFSPGVARGSGRDRQLVRADVQERAARDALRCAGGRVDVAPVRCPVRDQVGTR